MCATPSSSNPSSSESAKAGRPSASIAKPSTSNTNRGTNFETTPSCLPPKTPTHHTASPNTRMSTGSDTTSWSASTKTGYASTLTSSISSANSPSSTRQFPKPCRNLIFCGGSNPTLSNQSPTTRKKRSEDSYRRSENVASRSCKRSPSCRKATLTGRW